MIYFMNSFPADIWLWGSIGLITRMRKMDVIELAGYARWKQQNYPC